MRRAAIIVACICFTSQSAMADWRDDNPNQPNGYAASTFRYHHGTPGGDDGPANGYRASSFRSKHGLEGYMPPEDSSGGWGGGSSDRWGGGGSGGSALGYHFRKGQQEGQAYWRQRTQQQLQQRMGNPSLRPDGNPAMEMGSMRNRFMGANGGSNYSRSNEGMMGATNYGENGSFPRNGYASRARFAGAGGYSQMPGSSRYGNGIAQQQQYNTGNYQYAPSSTAYGNYGGNSTALRAAVEQRPIGTLLRNSRGGFNHIYANQ